MRIVKLSATASTNAYLKELVRQNPGDGETAVIAFSQTAGKGQQGNSWQSQDGKSLTFSIFKRIESLEATYHFYISMAVSLAVKSVLEENKIGNISVKWPNDILSGNKKICGILIENLISKGTISESIIGIGINVNEHELPGLPQATSVKIETGKELDLEVLMQKVLDATGFYFSFLSENSLPELKRLYEDSLFQKNKVSVFENKNNTLFNGIIQGVTEAGKLQILLENNVVREFENKEVRMMY